MSVNELAEPNTFESDDEVEDFLADLYASRAGRHRMSSGSSTQM